jgi:hypothetical protein
VPGHAGPPWQTRTGAALDTPALKRVGRQPKAKSPGASEDALVALVDAGKGKLTEEERVETLKAFASLVDGIDAHRAALRSGHAFDALVSAYTAWLAPDGLELPPPGFNIAAGWIWFPRVSTAG